MTARWAAARIGYLLTAAMSGRRYSEASGMWRELDEPAQADVISALGAQARVAVAEAGIPLQIDFASLADSGCTETLAAAQTAYEGTGPWEPPQCPHCRELVASTLAEIQLQAMIAAGRPASYIDLICRGKAAGGQLAEPSLEQAGHTAVGEGLAAGLAGGAVLERGIGERDLTDGVTADRAGLAGLAVHA
jgi:hypothetical protein